jgi:dynein heavy chain 1
MGMDAALHAEGNSKPELNQVLKGIECKLEIMAETVLLDLPSESRKKFEQLITELVHQRDVTRSMIDGGVSDVNDFRWLYHLRFDFNPKAENLLERLRISLSNASFYYGFEYLGIGERLVQTPLTDRCYLTLTQALHFRMGGNPFGPVSGISTLIFYLCLYLDLILLLSLRPEQGKLKVSRHWVLNLDDLSL